MDVSDVKRCNEDSIKLKYSKEKSVIFFYCSIFEKEYLILNESTLVGCTVAFISLWFLSSLYDHINLILC